MRTSEQAAPAVDLAVRLGELLRAEAFAHDAADLKLFETHISWVILAGDNAYKIRKPVNFGFLDFTSAENRLADCEAEVRLNRRLCPEQLYLGLVWIVEREGRLAIGGAGRPIEPAVWMRRLPERGMLPMLLERQLADERLMERIARQLAAFHAVAATGAGVDEHGSLFTIQTNWEENFTQTRGCSEDVLPHAHAEAIRHYVDEFLQNNQPLLACRVECGRIRDGHGDLHASSVCVLRRRVYLFDCLEFSQRFRCADVASEVAFLAMDLDHLGRADLGHTFVNAYVRHSGDSELKHLLRFYKCYRAFVRGKVQAFRLQQPGLQASDAERIEKCARAYFDLAHAYAAPPKQPLLLVIIGPPASGKTTLARALAGRLGLVHVSSDIVRKRLMGIRPTEHAAEGFGHGLYSRAMSRRTYGLLRLAAARWLRRGQSVVLDATYGQPAERTAIRKVARRAGARLAMVVCHANDAVLQARLAARTTDSTTASDARLELWPALKAAFVEPMEVPDVIVVDTARPVPLVVEQVMDALTCTHSRIGSAEVSSVVPTRIQAD